MKAAVASFRHCLELQPENPRARRDIELVRQWIKYYTEKWREHDRQKRRQETNLVAFLEFLIETQRALRDSVKALPAAAPVDAFAEPKRLQDELQEEIPALKDKIKSELTPPPNAAGGTAPQGSSQELEQGIALLEGWASTAGEKMSAAAHQLDLRQAGAAASEQQSAIDELEKIWDAVIPFHPLLARDLADQTTTAQSLAPAPAALSKSESDEAARPKDPPRDDTAPAPKAQSQAAASPSLGAEREDLGPLTERQERTLRRTRLLKIKAEAELQQLEKSQAAGAETPGHGASPSGKAEPPGAGPGQPKPVDPKQIKAGYEKAIELAPQAVEQMDQAVKALNRKAPQAAYPPAERARALLEEIHKAQPKNDEQDKKQQEQNKKNEDQQKKDQQKDLQKDQQKKDQEKKDQQKDQQKKDEQKDQEKKDQEKKQQDDSKKSDEQKQQQKQQEPQVSRDRIEEALRKVRERQQEKRERDRMMKARYFGRAPVEKDW